jgi:hypothetical protein
MTKRSPIKFIAIAIVLTTLALLFIVPAMQPETETSNMLITFYDEDGNELGDAYSVLPLNPFSIHGEGIEGAIHSLKVVVYFKVTTDIPYTGIDTRCWLTVVTTPNNPYASPCHTIAKHRLGWANTDLEGSFYRTTAEGHYLMSELLPASAITEAAKPIGWSMKFTADVETTIGLPEGHPEYPTKAVSATSSVSLQLSWSEILYVDGWFGDW